MESSPARGRQTLNSYFRSFYPGPRWAQIPTWPPDVFALCNLVLDHTEAFRFAVSPPAAGGWPPRADWNAKVAEAAAAWRACVGRGGPRLPALVEEGWDVVSRARDVPLSDVASGEAWELCAALLTLQAVADEACAGLAARQMPEGRSLESRAWKMLLQHGSLSHLSPHRVRVLPKTNLASRGITIRSLSRYLGLCYEAVDVRWRRVETAEPRNGPRRSGRKYNLMLLPWPLTVHASDFAPVDSPLGNMPSDEFGFFEFAPSSRLGIAEVRALLATAHRQGLRADGVVLPEAAVERIEVAALEDALAEHGASVLITGVREPPSFRQLRAQLRALLGARRGRMAGDRPGQAPPLVPGCPADPPVPPVAGAGPEEAVVGGDRHQRPGGAGRRRRWRHYGGPAGV